MKKLIKCSKSKAMLRIAMFATLFVLMDTFIEMNKKTEEQTTYSVTLENLALGNGETDGENTGGGGADGETGGGGTTGGTGGGTTGGDSGQESYTHPNHITDIDDCKYQCLKIVVICCGIEIKYTEEVAGQLIECHYSQGFNCNASGCTNTNPCPSGYN